MKKAFALCLGSLVIFSSLQSLAKGSDKGSIGWIGVGGGSSQPQAPDDTIDVNTSAFLLGGMDAHAWGPLFFVIGGALTGKTGKLDYKYLGSDNVTYQVDDLDFTAGSEEYMAGIKLRLINSKYFRFFIGGGGVYGLAVYKYDAARNTTIIGQGAFYETEQKDVAYSGYYGDAGFDLFFGGQFGLRFAGRFSEAQTDRINAIDKQHLRFRDTFGFLAFLKEL